MLWDLARELESIAHGLQRIEWAAGSDGLARRHHAHVDILLLGGLDLLLLLLQELDLLLDGKLFHCGTQTRLVLIVQDSVLLLLMSCGLMLWRQGGWKAVDLATQLPRA